MIQSSFHENRSVHFRVLSDDQVWEIKQASFDVLEKTGCDVLHQGALELLERSGAVVDGKRVACRDTSSRSASAPRPRGS